LLQQGIDLRQHGEALAVVGSEARVGVDNLLGAELLEGFLAVGLLRVAVVTSRDDQDEHREVAV
jgi:hypothetical protein